MAESGPSNLYISPDLNDRFRPGSSRSGNIAVKGCYRPEADIDYSQILVSDYQLVNKLIASTRTELFKALSAPGVENVGAFFRHGINRRPRQTAAVRNNFKTSQFLGNL